MIILCLALAATACGSDDPEAAPASTAPTPSTTTSTTPDPPSSAVATTAVETTTTTEAAPTTAPAPWPPPGYTLSKDGRTAWIESAPGYTCETGELPCVQVEIVSQDSCLTFGLTGRVVEPDGFEGSYLNGAAGTMFGRYNEITPAGQHVLGQLGRDAGSERARARVDDITCA